MASRRNQGGVLIVWSYPGKILSPLLVKALAKLSQGAEEPGPEGYCKVIMAEKPVLRRERYVLTSVLRPSLQLSLHSSFKFIKLNPYYILFYSAGILVFLTGTYRNET